MSSPTQASGSGYQVDNSMWVDNAPPTRPVASCSGGSPRLPSPAHSTTRPSISISAPEPTPSLASVHPVYPTQPTAIHDPKGKRKAFPSAVEPAAARGVIPFGRPIPILHAGQARTQPLPNQIPTDSYPPHSTSATISNPTRSPSPDASPDGDDSRSTRTRPPAIRIRRVGALDISVSSDSESSFSSRAAGRKRRKMRGERSSESSEEEGSGPSRELSGESSGRDNRRRPRVDEDQYRTIVDGLAMQNRALKGRLRKYESVRMSSELENERMFELRFFDSIPHDKRQELEGFLTRYVQGLAPLPTEFPAPASSSAPSTTAATHATSPPPTIVHSATGPLALPIIPERPPIPASRAHRHIAERERLAGPSYSGAEPASYTGTGNGMRVRHSPDHPLGGRASSSRGLAQNDTPSAREIVRIVENLFEDAIKQVKSGGPVSLPLLRHRSSGSVHTAADDTEAEPNGTTNEAYLAHLLKHDLHQWQYLNLAIQMSRLLRFAVTPAFVRSAIRTFSSKLEISSEGSRVRWIGGTEGQEEPAQSEEQRTSSAESVQTGYGQSPSTGPASTTGSRTNSIAASSAQPQSGSSLLANSKLGTTEGGSTAATSVSASSQKPSSAVHQEHQSPDSALVRPGPGVIQPTSHDDHPALVHSPEPLGLVTASAKQTSSQFVPYFDAGRSTRRAKASSAATSTGSEDNSPPKTERTAPGLDSRRSSIYRAVPVIAPVSSMTFFANAGFCSDLSTNRVGLAPVASAMEDGEEQAVLGCVSRQADARLAAVPLSLGPDAPSSKLLLMSGMSEVVAADSFTIRVQTAYPAHTSGSDGLEQIGAMGIAHDAKRAGGRVIRIEETREDPELSTRKPLSAEELYDSTDELGVDTEMSSTKRIKTSSEGGSASASDEGRKEAGVKRQKGGEADYLLSLAAPLYDWAPEGVSRSNLKRVRVMEEDKARPRRGEILSGGVRAKMMGLGQGLGHASVGRSVGGISRFSGSIARSGDEAPISLSDFVN